MSHVLYYAIFLVSYVLSSVIFKNKLKSTNNTAITSVHLIILSFSNCTLIAPSTAWKAAESKSLYPVYNYTQHYAPCLAGRYVV